MCSLSIVVKATNVVIAHCYFAEKKKQKKKPAWNCLKVRAVRAAHLARLFFPIQPIKFLIGNVVFVGAVDDAKTFYHQ